MQAITPAWLEQSPQSVEFPVAVPVAWARQQAQDHQRVREA